MATEIFAWGYTAWLTQRPSGYELSGYIDGRDFYVFADTPRDVEKAFYRAARRAWLRRSLRVLRGLPAHDSRPVGAADTYHEITIATVVLAIVTRLFRK